MFRPLEAIFRLHKIDLEEKEYNIYSKRNGVWGYVHTWEIWNRVAEQVLLPVCGWGMKDSQQEKGDFVLSRISRPPLEIFKPSYKVSVATFPLH